MMTCRRYIITGMNKVKKWLPDLVWVCVIAGSRILYFMNAGKAVADTYGYYEQGVQRAWENGCGPWAGLSDAYVWTLSWLYRLMGNQIKTVGVYQLTLQILWLTLLFVGIGMLLGRKAGFLTSGVLMIFPWVFRTIFVVSPENYGMLHFSALLVILGVVCRKKSNDGKAPERIEENQEEGQEQMQMEADKEEGYVMTQDGRKVKLFDNPLPLPPKHVKKTMGFDFQSPRDDFDHQVEDRDDFDY